jgi:hypothetical protein
MSMKLQKSYKKSTEASASSKNITYVLVVLAATAPFLLFIKIILDNIIKS